MEPEFDFQFPKVEYNAQGYTLSFDLDNFDPQEVSAFYQKYGFVVFDDVVSKEEAEKTID
jgi:hypothetical protein